MDFLHPKIPAVVRSLTKHFSRGFSQQLLAGFLFVMAVMSAQNAQSQQGPLVNPCDPNATCNAKDFTFDSVYLASDILGTPLTTADCNGPLPVSVYFCTVISNKTGSDRDGVYVEALLLAGEDTIHISYCFDELMPSNVATTLVIPAPSFWDCNTRIGVLESVIVWPTAANENMSGQRTGL